MDFILSDYLDSADSAAQYDALMSMADHFQFRTEFGTPDGTPDDTNDLPF